MRATSHIADPPPLCSFPELSGIIREEKTINSSRDFFELLVRWSNRRKKEDMGKEYVPRVTGIVNTKVFLAAWMMATYPKIVLGELLGDLELALIKSSVELIRAAYKMASGFNPPKGGATDAQQGAWDWSWRGIPWADGIHKLVCAYLRTFKNWKISDQAKLMGRLQRALRGIDGLIQAGVAQDGIDAAGFSELLKQRDALVEKMRKMDPSFDPASTAATAGNAGSAQGAVPGGAESGRKAQRRARVVVTLGEQPGQAGHGGGGGGGGMSNEQLAHELLIDGSFRLDERAGQSDEKLVHTKIRETFERAFWESLVEELSLDPPHFDSVLKVLEEIRVSIEVSLP